MRKKITKPKKRKKFYLPSLRFIFFIVLGIGAIFWMHYLFFVLEAAGINEILIDIPENFANKTDELKQSYIDLSKNNIFLAWLLKDDKNIFIRHSEFAGGDIEVDFFKRNVLLKPTIRNENSLWCKKNNQGCLAIDDSGYVSREVVFTQGANIMLIESADELLPIKGAKILSSDIFFYIKKINDLLVKNGFISEKYDVINRTDVNAFLARGFYLKLSSDYSHSDAFNYFSKLYNSLKDDERNNLEYIDLRIGNKVFYKLK